MDMYDFNVMAAPPTYCMWLSPTYLTSPAVCPEETAFSYSFFAFSFSFTSPTYTWPSILLWGTRAFVKQRERRDLCSQSRAPSCDWHAEVADEGGLGQLYFEEDFLRFVRFVQSLGGHDGVGETRRHGAVHRRAVHLHHLRGWHGERNWGCNADKSHIFKTCQTCHITSGKRDQWLRGLAACFCLYWILDQMSWEMSPNDSCHNTQRGHCYANTLSDETFSGCWTE